MVPATRRGAVGRRPQPPVARPDRPRHRRRAGSGRCSRPPAGRRSRSSTGAACASSSSRDGGEALRRRIDEMPNEEYQRLLRRPPPSCASGCPARAAAGAGRREADRPTSTTTNVRRAIRDLGGHDLGRPARRLPRGRRGDRPSLGRLRLHDQGLAPADRGSSRPTTPRCSRAEQWEELASELGADADESLGALRPRDRRRPSSASAPPRRLEREPVAPARAAADPDRRRPQPSRRARRPSRRSAASSSTSRHAAPEVAERVVTVSPDVASSTNLGGWINHAGDLEPRRPASTGSPTTPTRSSAGASRRHGQHIELGIAEGNLVGLLGELGATWSRDGQPLLPIGTIYDPFVEPRARAVVASASTPAGSRSSSARRRGSRWRPEGGAHQSIITPSVGLEQPGCVAWEPAFGQDLEWALLARARPPRPAGRRLGLLPPQHAADRPGAGRACRRTAAERERRRQDVLAGGYLLRAGAGRRRA